MYRRQVHRAEQLTLRTATVREGRGLGSTAREKCWRTVQARSQMLSMAMRQMTLCWLSLVEEEQQ